MNGAINELVRSVIAKNSLSECSVKELQELATQYPYFGPVQFLLAQKLKDENSPLYKEQSQRAILYFQDQLWYDYLSNDNDHTGMIISGPDKKEREEERAEEQSESGGMEKRAEKQSESGGMEERAEKQSESGGMEERAEEQSESGGMEERAEKQSESGGMEERAEEQSESGGMEERAEKQSESGEMEERAEKQSESGGMEKRAEEQSESGEMEGSDLPALPAFNIEPVKGDESALVFEPYHTVDYFASQGIRFKEEEKPKDRFGQQLRSFTEWLKTLKKIPETQISTTTSSTDEQKVTQLAEHSISDREVVTEAMADVWEKQGNKEKAIEIYRKLSLLNPAKSSYFASKIEYLKNL